MVTWLTGKTMFASVAGAACLTLALMTSDPTGNASAKAAGGDATVETTLARVADDQAVDGRASVEVTSVGRSEGGEAGHPGRLPTPRYVGTPAEDKIRAALDDPTHLEFPQTPLRNAIQFLADQHEINIIIDETALTEAGVSIDDNVDFVLDGIKLRSALDIMVEPYDLSYVVEDEVLKVTTEEVAERKVQTAAYDLSGVPGAREEGFEMKLQGLLAPPPIAGTPAGTVGFGTPVRVALFGDRLIVKGPRSQHEQIEEVLELLRAGR